MAAILFLAPADLGEAVLATGALAQVLDASDAVTIVCELEAASLFRAVPGLAALHTIGAESGIGARWSIWMRLARQRFDVLIDGRGGFLGRALPAGRRYALAPAPTLRHRTEDWAAALGIERALAPTLWLDEAARSAAATIAGPLLVLAPGGIDEAKRWDAERFAAVARRLANGALAGARIAVIGAAGRDEAITRAIVSGLESDGVAGVDLGAVPDLLAAAALMERATLCIGNDNALSQIAAVMGAPTLTIFGPTDERVRAPYGPRTRTLRGRSFEEAAALSALDARAAMEDVSIDAVEAAATELLHAGGLR